jgi:glycosyltransferase involved in cell wall biosynthesis
MKVNLVLNQVPQLSETFLVTWMQQLVQKGYEVRVLVIGKWILGGNDKKRFLKGIKYHSKLNLSIYFKGIFQRSKFQSYKSAVKAQFLNLGNPNWVHFSYSAIGVAYTSEIPVLQKQGVRFMVSCRGTSDNIKPYILKGRKEKLEQLFDCIDSVHCVSQEMANRMICDFGLESLKAFVNRPAIDLQRFTVQSIPRNTEKKIIVSTGRLEYVKGFPFALLAVKELIENNIDIEYRIVGGGKEMENLQFSIQRLGLENVVLLLGAKSSAEVIEEVAKADIYLSSSLSEGISNAVLEAMALGVPVVSTNIGGMMEVVIDNETGKLVEPYSSAAISKAILEIIDNDELRKLMVKNARKLIENDFHLGRLGEVFDAEYRRLNV